MHHIHFPQCDQPIAVATGDWVKQDLVGDAEHGRRPADAQSEDQDGHQGGTGVLQQLAEREFQIIHRSDFVWCSSKPFRQMLSRNWGTERLGPRGSYFSFLSIPASLIVSSTGTVGSPVRLALRRVCPSLSPAAYALLSTLTSLMTLVLSDSGSNPSWNVGNSSVSRLRFGTNGLRTGTIVAPSS